MCNFLNYFENFLIFVSAVSGYVSVSAFGLLNVVPVGIRSFRLGLKIWALPAGIKNLKSIIKRKKKKFDKIVFLTKKLNAIEVSAEESFLNKF